MNQTETSAFLTEGVARLGVTLTAEQVKAFDLYLQELKTWKSHINLIRRADDREIILKDFLDSLTILKYLPLGTSIVDLGSGAGFPGIPLKIARPDLKVVLLEATRKKVFFLRNLVRVLKLKQIEVQWAAREDEKGEADNSREPDFVVSRAFGPLLKFASTGSSFLKRGGILLAMKGKKGKEELDKNLLRLEKMGLKLAFLEEIQLPFLNHKRILIGLRKE